MKRQAIIAVIFPILVMAGWVVKLNYVRYFGTEVTLAITGYDPRDLLAGHYLRYAVSYGPEGTCGKNAYSNPLNSTCFCLVPKESGVHVASSSVSCRDRDQASCPVFIKGTCNYGRFEANIERFYFSEKLQGELAVVPKNATIKVRLDGNGNGQVTQLLVEGKDFREFIKK